MQSGKSVESRLKLKVRKFHESHFWDCADMGKTRSSLLALTRLRLVLAMRFVTSFKFTDSSVTALNSAQWRKSVVSYKLDLMVRS